MKFRQNLYTFLLSLITVPAIIHTEISLVNLKGMTSSISNPQIGVKQDYKDLSPAIGALFWLNPFLKNIYEYGLSESPYTMLVNELFHVHVDGSFDTTRLATKIAYYFDPRFIGKLVGIIFSLGRDLSRTKNPLDSKALSTNITLLVNTMVEDKKDMIQNALIENYNKRIRRDEQEIAQLKQEETRARKKLEQHKEESIELIEKAKKRVPDKDLQQNIDRFVQSITRTIEQELAGAYPRGLTINTLLAVLWKKANDKTDCKTYLNSVAETINVPTDQLYFWPNNQQEYTITDYNRLKSLTRAEEIGNLSIDDLIFTRFGYDLYDNPLPPKVGMIGNAHYMGKEFPDCGETSLRNLLNVLSYDSFSKKFDIKVLEALGAKNGLVAFYSDYAITAKIKENAAHNAWADVVSNLPGVRYGNDHCDISGGFSNMMHVISELFTGINSLQDIADRLKQTRNIDMTIESTFPLNGHDVNDVKLIIEKPGTNKFELVWHFWPHHFELDFPSLGTIPYAKKYADALFRDDKAETMSLVDAFIYASFEPDTTNLKNIPELRKDNLYIFFSVDTNAQKIEVAKNIAKAKNITDKDRQSITKLSKKISGIKELNNFFTSILTSNQQLATDIIKKQDSSSGSSTAIYTIITNDLVECYDWASNEKNLQIIHDYDISQLINFLSGYQFPQDKKKGNLIIKLYEWATKPEILQDATSTEIKTEFLITKILDHPFPQEEAQQKFILKLYDWTTKPEILRKLTSSEAIAKLMIKLLDTAFPQEEGKKNFILKLYEWATELETLQSLAASNENGQVQTLIKILTDRLLGTLASQPQVETKRFMLELYNWTLKQKIPKNILLSILQRLLNAPTPKDEGLRILMAQLYTLISKSENLNNLNDPDKNTLIIRLLYFTPTQNETTEKRMFINSLFDWASNTDILKAFDSRRKNLLLTMLVALPFPPAQEAEKKTFVHKLYDWAKKPETLQDIGDTNLSTLLMPALMKIQLPIEQVEKQEFIQDMVKNLESTPAIIQKYGQSISKIKQKLGI